MDPPRNRGRRASDRVRQRGEPVPGTGGGQTQGDRHPERPRCGEGDSGARVPAREHGPGTGRRRARPLARVRRDPAARGSRPREHPAPRRDPDRRPRAVVHAWCVRGCRAAVRARAAIQAHPAGCSQFAQGGLQRHHVGQGEGASADRARAGTGGARVPADGGLGPFGEELLAPEERRPGFRSGERTDAAPLASRRDVRQPGDGRGVLSAARGSSGGSSRSRAGRRDEQAAAQGGRRESQWRAHRRRAGRARLAAPHFAHDHDGPGVFRDDGHPVAGGSPDRPLGHHRTDRSRSGEPCVRRAFLARGERDRKAGVARRLRGRDGGRVLRLVAGRRHGRRRPESGPGGGNQTDHLLRDGRSGRRLPLDHEHRRADHGRPDFAGPRDPRCGVGDRSHRPHHGHRDDGARAW